MSENKKLSYGDAVKIFAIIAKRFSGKMFTIEEATKVLVEHGMVLNYYRLIRLFESFQEAGLMTSQKMGNTNYYAIKF